MKMSDNGKILYPYVFQNNYEDEYKDEDEGKRTVTNLKVSSSFKKKRGIGFRLVRKILPFLIVTPLYLGFAHKAGYSLHGFNLIHENTFYDDMELLTDNSLTYYGKWQKDSDGYHREVKYYNAEFFDDEKIMDILLNRDERISVLNREYTGGNIEYREYLDFIERIFNSSRMSHIVTQGNKTNIVSVASQYDLFCFWMLFFVFNGVSYFSYKEFLKSLSFSSDEESEIIDFGKRKKFLLNRKK